MPDSIHRLFPCSRLVRSRSDALVSEHFSAAVVVAGISLLVWVVAPRISGPALILGGAMVSYFTCFRSTVTLVEFQRRYQYHLGREAGRTTAKRPGPGWLVALLYLACTFMGVSLLAACGGFAVLGGYLLFRWFRRKESPLFAFRAFVVAVHLFLAYPDARFHAPAGTAAVWIPSQSMDQRSRSFAALVAGFYLPAFGGFLWTTTNGLRSPAPYLLLLAVPLIVLGLVALHAEPLSSLTASSVPAFPLARSEWDVCVSRVRNSAYVKDGVRMCDHFFLGYVLPGCEQAGHPLTQVDELDLPSPTPALLHESATDGHVHFLGPTGFGKTSIGQAGLSIQVIRGKRVPELDALGQPKRDLNGEPLYRSSDPVPMLALDLKGDLALFNTWKEECERRGQTFRFFTLEFGKATSYFNPISSLGYNSRYIIGLAEIVLNMLDLWHGQFFYGAGYYSEMSRNLLLKALQRAKTPPQTWEELYQLITETLDRREHRDAFELLGRIFALAQYPVLGPAPAGADMIHMPTVIENNECVYFWLPALASAMSVIAVAKMAIFSFMDAARAWNNAGRDSKKCWLFMDEAQVVCGQNMERIFQQASGSHLRIVLSNQSLASLDSRDAPNLSRTIRTNTRVKQAFGLVDPTEQQDWITISGEEVGYAHSYQFGTDAQGRSTSSWSQQEVVHPRLNLNVIAAVNNSLGSSLYYTSRDAGFCRFRTIPRQLRCPHPMSYADYRRRSATPWPDAAQPQARAGNAQATAINTQSPSDVESQAADKYAALEQLFEKQKPRRTHKCKPNGKQ